MEKTYIKGIKLRTYAIFKQHFNLEKHLQFGSRNQRRSICKFRISNHKLEIEQGHYYIHMSKDQEGKQKKKKKTPARNTQNGKKQALQNNSKF